MTRKYYESFVMSTELCVTRLSRKPYVKCKLQNGAFVCIINDLHQWYSDMLRGYEKLYSLPPANEFEQRVENLAKCHVPVRICFQMRQSISTDILIAEHRIVPFDEGV